MNYDFFVLQDIFVLQYIIEPNKIVYYKSIGFGPKLVCTEYKPEAFRFYNRNKAFIVINKIKEIFGIEFQIVRLCEV